MSKLIQTKQISNQYEHVHHQTIQTVQYKPNTVNSQMYQNQNSKQIDITKLHHNMKLSSLFIRIKLQPKTLKITLNPNQIHISSSINLIFFYN